MSGIVGPAWLAFYAEVVKTLTWRSVLGAVLMALWTIDIAALYLYVNWLSKAKQNASRRWIKEKLLDLAQQAAEVAKSDGGPVGSIQDQARLAITANLGKEEGHLFSSQAFGSPRQHGYAENLSAYLFALAEKL